MSTFNETATKIETFIKSVDYVIFKCEEICNFRQTMTLHFDCSCIDSDSNLLFVAEYDYSIKNDVLELKFSHGYFLFNTKHTEIRAEEVFTEDKYDKLRFFNDYLINTKNSCKEFIKTSLITRNLDLDYLIEELKSQNTSNDVIKHLLTKRQTFKEIRIKSSLK